VRSDHRRGGRGTFQLLLRRPTRTDWTCSARSRLHGGRHSAAVPAHCARVVRMHISSLCTAILLYTNANNDIAVFSRPRELMERGQTTTRQDNILNQTRRLIKLFYQPIYIDLYKKKSKLLPPCYKRFICLYTNSTGYSPAEFHRAEDIIFIPPLCHIILCGLSIWSPNNSWPERRSSKYQ